MDTAEPGTLLTTADSQTAGTSGASPFGLLPGAYFYATLCLLCCVSVPSQCLHVTKMQYVKSHKCILYPSVALRLTNSFASFKTVFNVFSQNKVLLWVGSQDAKGEFWAGEELHACLLGLDMTPWTGHVSRVPHCTVMYAYSSAAQSCAAYWPTELVMFSVWNHIFFSLNISENRAPQNDDVWLSFSMIMAIWRYPHFQTVPFGASISVLILWGQIKFEPYMYAFIAFGWKTPSEVQPNSCEQGFPAVNDPKLGANVALSCPNERRHFESQLASAAREATAIMSRACRVLVSCLEL